MTRTGDTAGPEQERRLADSLKPVTAFDHFLVGQERYKRGDLVAAIQSFSLTLQQRTDHFWAQCLWATACLQLNQPSEAKSGFNACIVREPEFAWLFLLRGFASNQLAELAADRIQTAPARLVDTVRAEVRFQRDAAARDYNRAGELLAAKPNDELRYALHVNRGLLCLQSRDFEKAAADLEAAIRLNERRPEAYSILALVYQKQDKSDDADAQYGRAIALQPKAALYRGRADVNLARKETTAAQRSQALADLEKAIRLEKQDDPLLARDHTKRGRVLYLDGRHAEALAAVDAALLVAADYPEAHRLRLEVLDKLNRHDDIVRSCDALIVRAKGTASVHERRGLARAELRDFPGAIEDMTSTMALGGEKTLLLCRRGWLYILAGRPQLALRDFESAIKLDVSIGDAYNGRGFAIAPR